MELYLPLNIMISVVFLVSTANMEKQIEKACRLLISLSYFELILIRSFSSDVFKRIISTGKPVNAQLLFSVLLAFSISSFTHYSTLCSPYLRSVLVSIEILLR